MKICDQKSTLFSLVAKTITSDSIAKKIITIDPVAGVIVSVYTEGDNDFHRVYQEAKKTRALTEYPDHIWLFAAFGDVHIHAREDVSGLHLYKEDFQSVAKASYNGGLLFACDMPNNPVAPIDDETYLAKYRLTMRVPFALLPYGGIGPKTSPLSFLVPYKAYMGHSVGDLFFSDSPSLDQALARYKNQYVSFHCEDPDILERHKNAATHFERRPIQAEFEATKFALSLIEKYQLKGKLCHYSSGDGLKEILAAKKRGVDVETEVTPQHLYFSEEEILNLEDQTRITQFQMNPPIRSRYNRDLLLEALKRGEIDYLATDHAPHSIEEKKKGMSGLTGLDTFASFTTWLMLEKNVDPKIIAKVAAENPGEFYNRFHGAWLKDSPYQKVKGLGLGKIQKGYSASFTLLDMTKPQAVSKDFLKTKAMDNPFVDHTFPGSVHGIYFNGQNL